MRILITGVAGFLGSHLAAHLRDAGHDVAGIDNLSGGYLKNVPWGVELYVANLDNSHETSRLFEKIKPQAVYHLAAYAAEGLSPFIREYNYRNNVMASAVVINNCARLNVEKLIFASSMAVYGFGLPPFRETQTPEPIDPYGIAKYAVEMDLAAANRAWGLKYAIVRPHNIIGVNQNIWDKYRNVIGIWIRQALNGEDLTIFGDGEQVRAFSDVKFYMNPLKNLLTEDFSSRGHNIFNLGADKYWQIRDAAAIVQKVAKSRGRDVGLKFLEKRDEVKVAYCNHELAKQLLGFHDETDLEQTVTQMYDWAAKEAPRLAVEITPEVTRGLYPYWRQ